MSTEITKPEAPLSKVRQQSYVRPYYEIDDLENAYEVRVHLPGVARDSASVTLDKDTLVIEASRTDHWDKSFRPVYREITQADYRLRLQLNVRVEESKISAKTKDGVLVIHLPVSDEAKPRTIKIK